MKIVHVIFNLHIGGAENIMIDMMNEQIKLGHSISLVIVNVGINSSLISRISAEVNITRLMRPKSSKNILHFSKLYLKLININAEVIHCHNINMGRILYLFKNKLLLTVHDTIRNKIDGNATKYYADVISITQFVQKSLLEKSNIDSFVIHNGIYTEMLTIAEKCVSKSFKILQISRLNYEKKGQDILINAISLLVNSVDKIDITCDFIGDGPSFDYLQDLVVKLGLENYINFLGSKNREYVYENLHNYDLLVQPSRYEGFGLTIIEAMSAKVPVLVSNIEGPMEVIKNGELGVSFKDGDIEDLADKIEYIINTNMSEKVNLSYEFSRKNYDIRQTVFKYIDRYKMIANHSKV